MQMQKEYVIPELEVVVMSAEDIMSASGENDVIIDVDGLFE